MILRTLGGSGVPLRGGFSHSRPALAPLVGGFAGSTSSPFFSPHGQPPLRMRRKRRLKFAEYIANEDLLAPKVEPLVMDQRTGWTKHSQRCGVICRKLGMAGMWNEYMDFMPVTALQVMDNVVVQIKDDETDEKDGYIGLQIGAGLTLPRRVKKPQLGHFESRGLQPMKKMMEFRVTADAVLPVGTPITAAHFVPGQMIDVQANSKGKGFQGVMKRWGMKGGRASHGAKNHRQMGSTGQCQDPGKVWKGKKMPGRMGGKTTTVKNLWVWKVDTAHNVILVKGHVPGPKYGWVRVIDAKNKSFDVPPPFPTWDEHRFGTPPPMLSAESKVPEWYQNFEKRQAENPARAAEGTSTSAGPDPPQAVAQVKRHLDLFKATNLYNAAPNFYQRREPIPVQLYDQEEDDAIVREFLKNHWDERAEKLPDDEAAALAQKIEENVIKTKRNRIRNVKPDIFKKVPPHVPEGYEFPEGFFDE